MLLLFMMINYLKEVFHFSLAGLVFTGGVITSGFEDRVLTSWYQSLGYLGLTSHEQV